MTVSELLCIPKQQKVRTIVQNSQKYRGKKRDSKWVSASKRLCFSIIETFYCIPHMCHSSWRKKGTVPQGLIKPMGEGTSGTITFYFIIFLERCTWMVFPTTNCRVTWFLQEWIQQQTLTYPYNQKLQMVWSMWNQPNFFSWEECSYTVLHYIFIEAVLTLKTLFIIICPVMF